MQRQLIIASTLAVAGAVALAVSASAQSVGAPVVQRVDLRRGAICTGDAAYLAPLSDAASAAVLGAGGRSLPIIIPCARLDAADALLPLPSNLGGKLAVQTQSVSIYRRADGGCYAELVRTLTPVDADALAWRGVASLSEKVDPVPCARLAQALVGAQIVKGAQAAWPAAVAALPLPVEP